MATPVATHRCRRRPNRWPSSNRSLSLPQPPRPPRLMVRTHSMGAMLGSPQLHPPASTRTLAMTHSQLVQRPQRRRLLPRQRQRQRLDQSSQHQWCPQALCSPTGADLPSCLAMGHVWIRLRAPPRRYPSHRPRDPRVPSKKQTTHPRQSPTILRPSKALPLRLPLRKRERRRLRRLRTTTTLHLIEIGWDCRMSPFAKKDEKRRSCSCNNSCSPNGTHGSVEPNQETKNKLHTRPRQQQQAA
jgi:hypothetical protein